MTTISTNKSNAYQYAGQQFQKMYETVAPKIDSSLLGSSPSDDVKISREARSLEGVYEKKKQVLKEEYTTETQQLEQEYQKNKARLEQEFRQKKQSLGISTYA